MTSGPSTRGTVTAALNQMVLERLITHYETNFYGGRTLGAGPQVTVWIRAQDEMSRARTRRRVQEALKPFVKGLSVMVRSEAATKA